VIDKIDIREVLVDVASFSDTQVETEYGLPSDGIVSDELQGETRSFVQSSI
jgi:hypothetical protein